MTDAGVPSIARRSLEAFRAATDEPARRLRRPTDAVVEADAGTRTRVFRRRAVGADEAGGAEALEGAVARIDARSAVTARLPAAGGRIRLAPAAAEARRADAGESAVGGGDAR